LDEDLFYRLNAWKGGAFHLPGGIVERDIHETACRFLDEKEILTFLGLRQTGKSNLVFQLISNLLKKGVHPDRIFYFTFDDLSFRQELSASQAEFLKILERFLGEDVQRLETRIYLFIDEVQKLPGFLEYVKDLYDLRLQVKWVLTGSSSLTLKAQIKESLAGRVLSLPVLPFSENELFKGRGYPPPDKSDLRRHLVEGRNLDRRTLKRLQAQLLPGKRRMLEFFDETLVFGGLPAVALTKDPEKKKALHGVALENSIANRLSAWLPLLNPELRLHYWRTRSQEEVDLVISAPDRLIPVEVKSDRKLQKKDLKGLRRFLEKEKEKTGILVGRFAEADILEEGRAEIILLPHWMI